VSAADRQIEEVLHRIYDPCSLAQQNPISLIDMGLVLGWELGDEGHLEVRMCVTSACCTMAPHFTEAAREQLSKLPEVQSVDVVVDAAFFWTPDRMTARGKEKLAVRRRATIAVTGVKPMQWKELADARN
jgi:metal-sulfur cluster biosynthetic enzyme